MSEALIMSPTIGKLADALAKAQSVLRGAEKDRANPFFKRNYATLSSVWEACREALTANGLSVMQPVSSQGKAVTVTTLLSHASGEWVRADLTVEAKDAGAQSIGSAISYGRRYGLSSMVGVAAAEDDDDGNAATHGQGATAPARSKPRPPEAKTQPAKANGTTKPEREPGSDDVDPARENLEVDLLEMQAALHACAHEDEHKSQHKAIAALRKRMLAANWKAGDDKLTTAARESWERITGKPAIPGDGAKDQPMPEWGK